MPKFTVTIEGKNFLGRHSPTQRDQKFGFITIVLVEAENQMAAETAAIAVLKSDEELRLFPKNDPNDPPLLMVGEIVEVRQWPPTSVPRTGLVWFPEP